MLFQQIQEISSFFLVTIFFSGEKLSFIFFFLIYFEFEIVEFVLFDSVDSLLKNDCEFKESSLLINSVSFELFVDEMFRFLFVDIFLYINLSFDF